MRIKPWPKGINTIDFEKIVQPICKAIEFCYKLERHNVDKDIPYNGYDIIDRACVLPASFIFKAENLAYSLEDQGRDALEEIISHAVRLGIEQGRRIAMSDTKYKTLEANAKMGELLVNQALGKV